MLFCGLGETAINNLFAAINLPHISATTLKRRERETGIVFESVADMTCDDAIAEEKRQYNTFTTKCFDNFHHIFLYINIFEIKFVGFNMKLYYRCENEKQYTASFDAGWQTRGSGKIMPVFQVLTCTFSNFL